MTMTNTSHVTIDDRGVEWLDDTSVKVIEVVADHLANGTSPKEMRQYVQERAAAPDSPRKTKLRRQGLN